MKRRWAAGLAVGLLVAGLVGVRTMRVREKDEAKPLTLRPPAVEVTAVREGAVADTRHFLGEVSGVEEALLSSRIVAPVTSVLVREGDRVQRGQVLVRLEAAELESAVRAAEAGASSADVAFSTQREVTARDHVLFDAKAISQEEWDRSRASEVAAESRLAAAREAVEAARQRRGYAAIVAPFSGAVARRDVDPGDLAVPGKPLLSLVHGTGIRVRVKLPGEMLTGVAAGQVLFFDAPSGRVEGHVTRVFPAMDASHLATVEADLTQAPAGLVAGATLGVDVQVSSATGWVVPSRALLEGESGSFVFRAQAGHAEQVPVRVASRSPEAAVVTGALRAGDNVIVAQPARLMTLAGGAPVTVVAGGHP